jgi:hypothetical protein
MLYKFKRERSISGLTADDGMGILLYGLGD